MYLSENGVARWALRPDYMFENDKTQPHPIGWIPTPENMLEDAILMIALYVWKDEETIRLAEEVLGCPIEQIAVIGSTRDNPRLHLLYEKCRSLKYNCKLMISVFETSSILRQLPTLEHYDFEIEVCKSVYSRFYNHWKGAMDVKGSLLDGREGVL
jgi:hypothetical protein